MVTSAPPADPVLLSRDIGSLAISSRSLPFPAEDEGILGGRFWRLRISGTFLEPGLGKQGFLLPHDGFGVDATAATAGISEKRSDKLDADNALQQQRR